ASRSLQLLGLGRATCRRHALRRQGAAATHETRTAASPVLGKYAPASAVGVKVTAHCAPGVFQRHIVIVRGFPDMASTISRQDGCQSTAYTDGTPILGTGT